MKKYTALIVLLVMSFVLASCGKKQNNAALKKYDTEMRALFTEFESIDKAINAIDPESQTAIDELFANFDKLDEKFKVMASVEVPTELAYFESIKSLAAEGSDYMTQANDYLKQAFTETEFHENMLEAALECYRRANKRVQVIISLIHGVVPEDVA